MRRRRAITILLVVGVLLLTTVAEVALAKTFSCASGSTKENPCKGTKKADDITGTDGNDYILAGRGKDEVIAGGGNDVVYGGRGADRLSGTKGDDYVYGGAGNDIEVHSHEGNDHLYGGEDDDLITDYRYATEPADEDVVFDGPGDDTIDLKDDDGLDTLCTTDGETLDFSDPSDEVIDDQELCALL